MRRAGALLPSTPRVKLEATLGVLDRHAGSSRSSSRGVSPVAVRGARKNQR